MSEKVPITVVLGIGTDGKAHASRFERHDQPFVARAAALMGFHVISVSPENEELHGIAAALPLGKIFATGRAFVPFVSRAAFEKLAPLVEGGIGTAKPAAPTRCGPRLASAASCLPSSRSFTAPDGGKAWWSASRATN